MPPLMTTVCVGDPVVLNAPADATPIFAYFGDPRVSPAFDVVVTLTARSPRTR